MSKVGIKETKEAANGVITIGCVLVKHLKDGVQFEDLFKVMQDIQGNPAARAEIEAALAQIDQVPAEVSDIDISETIDLGSSVIKRVPEILASLK